MMGAEWLRLPSIQEGTPEEQLRDIRNYLFQLSEQLQYALSHGESQSGQDWEGLLRPLLNSGELMGSLTALTEKRLEGRYLSGDSWEADRRRVSEEQAKVLCRLGALEDRASREEPAQSGYCWPGTPGMQTQQGERVHFTALPHPAGPLQQLPDGHWRA